MNDPTQFLPPERQYLLLQRHFLRKTDLKFSVRLGRKPVLHFPENWGQNKEKKIPIPSVVLQSNCQVACDLYEPWSSQLTTSHMALHLNNGFTIFLRYYLEKPTEN